VHLSVQLVVQEPVPEVQSWCSHKRSIGHGEGYLSIHLQKGTVLISSFCLQGWGYHRFQNRLHKPFFSYFYFLLCKKWVIKLLLRPLLPKVDIKSIIICYLFWCYLYIFKLSIIISVWRCRSLCTRYCKTEVRVLSGGPCLAILSARKVSYLDCFFRSWLLY